MGLCNYKKKLSTMVIKYHCLVSLRAPRGRGRGFLAPSVNTIALPRLCVFDNSVVKLSTKIIQVDKFRVYDTNMNCDRRHDLIYTQFL